jgi:gluconolactonase
MYAAPPEIPMRVFAEVPPELRLTGRHSDWLHGRGPAYSFLEGPAIDRDGHLWLTDIPFGRLFRVSPEGHWTVALECDGEPNGLAIHRDGRVFITDHKRGLLVLDPRSGKLDAALPRARREGSRASTTSPSHSTATSTSPTRGRPACTIRQAASSGCAPRPAMSIACSTTCRVRTA